MHIRLLDRYIFREVFFTFPRGAPGKSGLHASGEGERLIALEPW